MSLVLRTRVRAVRSPIRRASCSWKRVPIGDIARPYTCCERRLNCWTRCFGCRLVGRSLPHGPISVKCLYAVKDQAYVVGSTPGRYMALFKVVLCAWGEIVEKRFLLRHPVRSTQGPAIYSMQSLAYELSIADCGRRALQHAPGRIAPGE